MKFDPQGLKTTFTLARTGSNLSYFRIILGLSYFIFFLRLVIRKKFSGVFIKPDFLFAYDWLPELPVFRGEVMWMIMAGLLLSSLLIVFNRLVRVAFLFVFVGFGYFFFLEKALYNNHYFLLWLMALWGFIVFENKGPLEPWQSGPTEAWRYLILKGQVMMVYFFGGIAKFNEEWLKGDTTRSLLELKLPEVEPGLILDLSRIMTYGGLLFDLCIPFLLVYKPTRLLAVVAVLVFNISNHFVFEIGIFPFLMMGSLILFFDKPSSEQIERPKYPSRLLVFSLASFLFLSVIPFRHLLYPGNVVWTEEGYFFSWRMISSVKKVIASYRLIDRKTGDQVIISPREELNSMQYHALGRYPELAWQYAHHLKKRYQEKGWEDPIVNGKIQVKMNKRRFQFVFDPNLDLGSLDHKPLSHFPEILPVK